MCRSTKYKPRHQNLMSGQRCNPGKEPRYPLKRRLRVSQSRSGKENLLPLPGSEPRTVQPLACHYVS
jgi:hypothetical protein